MNIVSNYVNALEELYAHVGFTEDWVVYPVDDKTDMLWYLCDDCVGYANKLEDFKTENHYLEDIYTQRFYRKWVYEGEQYTMVFCDSGVDGMKWFRVFDNSKKIEEGDIKW